MVCLGIETSCDETALAFVHKGECIGEVIGSQVEMHALFGGVVPELASREHCRYIGPLLDHLMEQSGVSLNDVSAIAVTRGPGLLGALLIGVAFAKSLAMVTGKPLVGINHLHAHLFAAGLEQEIVFPAVGLLVSGGHTHSYKLKSIEEITLLGKTIDDAAGEACDKFAKMLGLPYPGGALLDRIGQQGIVDDKLFPRPYVNVESLDFSFSGLKTAALRYINEHSSLAEEGKEYTQGIRTEFSSFFRTVCASYLYAVADTLRLKIDKVLQEHGYGIQDILVAGGVASNSYVRFAMKNLAKEYNKKLVLPSSGLCTDNAQMVAYLGELLIQKGLYHDLSLSAIPRGHPIPFDYLSKH